MQTECSKREVVFQGHGRRDVTARFDAGRLSSDGGALLLREADRVLDVTRRLSGCFTNHRSTAAGVKPAIHRMRIRLTS